MRSRAYASLFLVCGTRCSIFYKIDSLTELPSIFARMSPEQREDYSVRGLTLSVLFVVCVLGVLVFSAVIAATQLVQDRRLFSSREAMTRGDLRRKLKKLGDPKINKLLIAALDKVDKDGDRGNDAAKMVFAVNGLHPKLWGISKAQLIEFGTEVRAALNRGEIKGQPDPAKPFYYPQDKFDDPKTGPNMHQVNAGLIKPMTLTGTNKEPAFMSGLSYAVMRNFATGGLPCQLFISHAWCA